MTSLPWVEFLPIVGSSFLASLVEFVEALTVVLAIAAMRGLRPALLGSLLGLAILTLAVVAVGPALATLPIRAVQLTLGPLLLLFGLRWLRKAVLRAAGLLPLHDEAAVFAAETDRLKGKGAGQDKAIDWGAIAAACQIILLEGGEVIFVVLAVGTTGGQLPAAGAGAALALLLVALLGALLHRPLTRVPENVLKFCVGVLVTAFGVFWCGEAIGITWPAEGWSLLLLIALFAGTSLTAVAAIRRKLYRRQ